MANNIRRFILAKQVTGLFLASLPDYPFKEKVIVDMECINNRMSWNQARPEWNPSIYAMGG